MSRYMLDTDIVSDMMRNPGGRVTSRIAEVGEERICLSISEPRSVVCQR